MHVKENIGVHYRQHHHKSKGEIVRWVEQGDRQALEGHDRTEMHCGRHQCVVTIG